MRPRVEVVWLCCKLSTSSFMRNHLTMSGLGPSPTLYVRRTTTWRPRAGLYRTTVTVSSRIDQVLVIPGLVLKLGGMG